MASSDGVGAFSASSAVRAAGVTLAAALGGRSSRTTRAVLLAATHAAARRIDPAGLQPAAISRAGDLNVLSDVGHDLVAESTGALSWAGLNLAAEAGLGRLHLPRVVRAVVLGGAVYAADLAVGRATAGASPA